jgi:hypothetical protein
MEESMTQPAQSDGALCGYCLGPLMQPPTWSNNASFGLPQLEYALHGGTRCGQLVHAACGQHARDGIPNAGAAGAGCLCGQGTVDGSEPMAAVDQMDIDDDEEEEEEEEEEEDEDDVPLLDGRTHEQFPAPESEDDDEEEEEEADDRQVVCAACDRLLAVDPDSGGAYSWQDTVEVMHDTGLRCGWRMHLECAIRISAETAPGSFRQCHCGNAGQIQGRSS